MTDIILATAVSLAAAIPAAAIGWAAGRVGERLTEAPGLRHVLWSGVVGLGVLSAAAVPAWTLKPMEARRALPPGPVRGLGLHWPAAIAEPAVHPLAPLIEPLATSALVIAAIGAAAGLGLWAMRLAHLRGIARRALPAEHTLKRAVAGRAAALGLRAPDVCISEQAPTAILVGLRQPAIILPAALVEMLGNEALTLICAHELAHLKRGDHWRAPLERLLGCLMWFNPFLIDALARRAAAGEALCDAMALDGADAAERRRYAATLVQALRLSGAQTLHPAFIRRKGPGHAMRLKSILNPAKKPGRRTAALSGVLLLLTSAGALGVSGVMARSMPDTQDGAQQAKTTHGSIVITSDLIDFEGGTTKRYGNTVQNEGGKAVYRGTPTIKVQGVNPHATFLLNGKTIPDATSLNAIPSSRIERIESMTGPSTAEGWRPVTLNIVTRPGA